jgi:amino acid transporter
LATYIAVTVIGVFYTVCSWAIVVAYGPAQIEQQAGANTSGLVFDAAARYLGAAYADVLNVLLLTSLFAALLAFHNAIARYLYALGRQGLVVKALARTHSRHGSPHVGSLAQTGSAGLILAVFALLGADPVLNLFTWMSGLATISMLVLMILTGIAVIAFFGRNPVDTNVWRTRIAPALGLAGLVGVTALALANFTTLISGSTTLAGILLALVAAFFGGGLLLAWRTRHTQFY